MIPDLTLEDVIFGMENNRSSLKFYLPLRTESSDTHESKFGFGLLCLRNGLLNVLQVCFRHYFSNALL
ncbi:MAG: hypothetical protein LAT67_13290 [Balneolales bacterium]|nr:hypothetical protein [Balneolales bacterium]